VCVIPSTTDFKKLPGYLLNLQFFAIAQHSLESEEPGANFF
jgi:hypothetical protein